MHRLVTSALLALALAPLAAAQEAATEYALQGTDARRGFFRGQLTVRARPDHRFDVALRVTYPSGETRHDAGILEGSGRRLDGRLEATPGLAGGLSGEVASGSTFGASFDLRDGTCSGSHVRASSSAWFWGARPVTEPAGEAYEARTPAEKQAALWREVSAVPYGALPALGSHGVGETVLDTLNAFRRKVLDRTFAEASDARPARTKLFHPFGSVASVRYEPVGSHAYTGLYASGGAGLARLSLATDADAYVPGIALKLLVEGRPSVNVHAIPSFDAQASRDFFERAPSNEIPEPTSLAIKLFSRVAAKVANPLRRPIEHLAAVGADGAAVAAPRSPARLFFRPAEVHFPADSARDFRDLLATIPPGTVIYRVYAVDAAGAEAHIGDVRTTSSFVASEWGDRVLHFKHER